MSRALGLVLVALLAVLAGCTSLGGPAADSQTSTTVSPAPTPTTTPTETAPTTPKRTTTASEPAACTGPGGGGYRYLRAEEVYIAGEDQTVPLENLSSEKRSLVETAIELDCPVAARGEFPRYVVDNGTYYELETGYIKETTA